MLICSLIATLGLAFPALVDEAKPGIRFQVSVTKGLLPKAFSGRVFVLLTPVEPRPISRGLNWFNPQPGFAIDVKDWNGQNPLVIDHNAIAFPVPLAQLKKGNYWVQAIVDRDLGGIDFAASTGNLYSKAIRVELDPAKPKDYELAITEVYTEPIFKETDEVKLFELESPSLTKFYSKSTMMRGAVILPPGYDPKSGKKYPIVYEIPGFGGDHKAALGIARRNPWDVAGVEMLWVVLDPHCRLGHHVFADSDNNGPVGHALINEFIPALEKKFNAIGAAGARFVTGHSSGGWSSLWLQVTYPETFGGCWSTSPDPVDFRDFQIINLYATDENMFTDREGKRRPLARRGDKPVLYYKDFSDMEVLMGRGGQLGSFEAAFSPKGADGNPLQVWDRKTGVIATSVAKTWEKYDIRLILERNWSTLSPKLDGKIHVYMGDKDTFYLEGATRLLKEWRDRTKADATVELFPGKTHSLVDSKLRLRMNAEMALAYIKWDMARTVSK